tara:strand:+ start:109 stop:672 length:564 start_codon:yes stop_codon:yes gene_type:complete
MGKETSQIYRFHDSMDAFYIAFHSTFVGTYDSDNDPHDSNLNDHFEIESSNPADTIPVATFLRNEKLTDEIIKKQYLYVCSFERESTIGYREKFKDYLDNGMDILEALKKSDEGPKIIRTCHLLFEIRGDRWDNNDGITWMRVPLYACEDASSHKEGAEWMLNELTTKGNEVYDADYFKKGTLEILI